MFFEFKNFATAVFWSLAVMVSMVASAELLADEPLDFARDIRPILSNKCFICHGPDANTREGGFRLDVKESAFAEADSGETPIVAGDAQRSELLLRIHADDDSVMPPENSDLSLTEDEKQILARWIETGAAWSQHWAFETPIRKSLPDVKDVLWSTNDIDKWVLANLESKGVVPSNPAAKETLIRRLSLDLTGMPPTIEQIDSYLDDKSDGAYEKVVDRLLASPHFGEHFASGWLDAARFADTNGYQNDFKRSMWVWRDWVIDAFNENLPYDQFVTEQLAGDLIPDASMKQIIATGFNRNHRTVTEGGSIEEEWHVENLVDRVETTSTVFLGLTMGCARCHDHKYDPISQREFYQFFAFFNSIDEKGFHNEKRGNVPPLIKVPTPQYKADVAATKSKIKDGEEALAQQIGLFNQKGFEADLSDRKDGMQRPVASVEFADETMNDSLLGDAFSFEKEKHQPVDKGDGYKFEREKSFTVSAWVKPSGFGAVLSRMDVENGYRGFDVLLNDDGTVSVHFVHKWYHDAIKITTVNRIERDEWTYLAVTYDGTSKADSFKIYFSSKQQPAKTNHDGLKSTTLTDHPLLIGLRKRTSGFVGQIAGLKIFDSCLDQAAIVGNAIEDLVGAMQAKTTDEEKGYLAHQWLVQTDGKYFDTYHGLRSQREKLRKIEETIPTVMVMKEAKQHRPTYVLNRGEYDKPIKDEEIHPAFPSVLPGAPEKAGRLSRMDLAKWLVDPENPLTARVAVNRLWSQIFGIGLHKTVEDFGVQSPQPSNQDLLDYLAIDFIDSGWDVKGMIKKMVMSSTYRQTSDANAEAFRVDPANRILARGSRFRLSAEEIRDNALAISGLLTRRIGGESVKPYQPEGLWDELAGGAGEGKYVMDRNDNLYRRSLYIYRKRTVPHPTMSTFDASNREICQVSRQRTNTPLQALALLNDATYVEAARHLALRAIDAGEEHKSQLEFAFRTATARFPSEVEYLVLQKAYLKALEHFGDHPDAAKQLLSVGVSQVDEDNIGSELAAMATVCSMILNLDETITRE